MNRCLECDKPLARRAVTVYSDTGEEKPPPSCKVNVNAEGRPDYYAVAVCKGRKFTRREFEPGGSTVWACDRCGSEARSYRTRRTIVSRTLTGREGYAGLGFFCSKTCGWMYALRAVSWTAKGKP